MGLTEKAGRFRVRFRDLARTAIADDQVLIELGHPGKKNPRTVIVVGDTTADYTPGPQSTLRKRDVTITQAGAVYCYEAGGVEAEQVVSDRAFGLAAQLEQYFGVDNTTLASTPGGSDGLVFWCMATKVGPAGGSLDESLIANGRLIVVPFLFVAETKIR